MGVSKNIRSGKLEILTLTREMLWSYFAGVATCLFPFLFLSGFIIVSYYISSRWQKAEEKVKDSVADALYDKMVKEDAEQKTSSS